MTKKVFNMAGGMHSAAAYTGLENRMYGSVVANDASMLVTAGTGMNVSIAPGDGLIDTGEQFARRIQIDSPETAPVTAASPTLPRMDSVVAFIDNGVTIDPSQIDNVNNVLKIAVVAGQPNASPQAPAVGAIQAVIGAGNPYMILANVTIPAGATNLSNAVFDDTRKTIFPITNERIGEKAVESHNINFATLFDTSLNLPTKSYNKVHNATYGLVFGFTRVGNIVQVYMNAVVASLPALDGNAGTTIPVGYRPVGNVVIPGGAVVNGANSNMGYSINPNGANSFSNNAPFNITTRLQLGGSYITNDPFPE